jgi:hypothetical protein
MKHVKWKFPEEEEDFSVHFLKSVEWTLCGLAFEGAEDSTQNVQGFVMTTEKVSCSVCMNIVRTCKKVKNSEME